MFISNTQIKKRCEEKGALDTLCYIRNTMTGTYLMAVQVFIEAVGASRALAELDAQKEGEVK